MLKNILVAMVLMSVYQSSHGNEVIYTKLANIPDNELAACRVKSNNFVFLCHLNRKNMYSCKFALGFMFTPPVCKECDKPKVETVLTPDAVKSAAPNPLLDAIRKVQANKAKQVKK